MAYAGPASVRAGTDRLLDRVARRLGRPVRPEWREALRAVPRHLFLPARLWLRDGDGGHELCDRGVEPERWWEAVWTDAPLVTDFTRASDGTREPSSSASAPSTVIRMLQDAWLDDGARVLEIGTGTGFNAALLAHRLGDDRVTSVEIAADLAERARASLVRAGRRPAVVHADGARGWEAGAPYDRIVATCSVRALPTAWLAQTTAGGTVVTPWETSWCTYGTLVLTRHRDGGASGRFAPYGSYMVMRGQRPDVELRRDVLREGQVPDTSRTPLSPWAVAGEDLDALFAVGLAVPGAWHSWDTDTGDAHTRLWLADDEATSWAAVDYDGRQTETFRVAQYGPRRLWDEVAEAYGRWHRSGRPPVSHHGLAITPDGAATVWQAPPD